MCFLLRLHHWSSPNITLNKQQQPSWPLNALTSLFIIHCGYTYELLPQGEQLLQAVWYHWYVMFHIRYWLHLLLTRAWVLLFTFFYRGIGAQRKQSWELSLNSSSLASSILSLTWYSLCQVTNSLPVIKFACASIDHCTCSVCLLTFKRHCLVKLLNCCCVCCQSLILAINAMSMQSFSVYIIAQIDPTGLPYCLTPFQLY